MCAKRQRLDDVETGADAAVHKNCRPPIDRVHDRPQCFYAGKHANELATTVVGDDHTVCSGINRFARIVGIEHALDDERSGPVLADPEDAFCILYTSGTAGQPKGAILTHLGIIHSLEHYRRTFELGSGDVSALAVPASHVTGLVALVLSTLHSGGTLCLMESFRARDFLALVEDERITYTLMVPAMYNLCLLCPDLTKFDLSSWRAGGFGGAPMPETTIASLHEAIPGLALSNVYGATETTSPATFLPGSDALSHSGSVGRVLPCADIVVTDDAGREVPAGTRGELLIGGPMVIPGYWDNDEANAKSFVGGYWRSGDIGSMDADGYLVIHDRLKDVVNRGGYKIYCIEVENVIAQFPGVVECAVVGGFRRGYGGTRMRLREG